MARERRKALSRIYGPDAVWLRTDWFCLICGQRDVWQEEKDHDDFYIGCSTTCFSCGHIQNCMDKVRDEPEKPAPWWDREELKR